MSKDAKQHALDVMAEHIAALNDRDEDRLAATLHFPHFRMSEAELKIWETPQDYFSDFSARAGSNWGWSEATDIVIVDSSETKVHLDVLIRRYDQNDTLLTEFRSLWVMANRGGHWAAAFRSSFAPR